MLPEAGARRGRGRITVVRQRYALAGLRALCRRLAASAMRRWLER